MREFFKDEEKKKTACSIRQESFIQETRYPSCENNKTQMDRGLICLSEWLSSPEGSWVHGTPPAYPFPNLPPKGKLVSSVLPVLPFLPSSYSFSPLSTENTQSTYRVSPDGSLRVTFASGMEIGLSSEPHILVGAVNPTLGKCNISLPGEHSTNLIEWRQRKEQNKGNISAFERRLRVRFYLIQDIELSFYF